MAEAKIAASVISRCHHASLAHLERLGIVGELTRRQRGRVFSYRRYVETLNADLGETA